MSEGIEDGSSDDDGMGGSSSIAASASGFPNGNHQRHHQRQEERGESVPLGKSVLPYITLRSDVNKNLGLHGWRVVVEMMGGVCGIGAP
jgi:hypothetical protein